MSKHAAFIGLIVALLLGACAPAADLASQRSAEESYGYPGDVAGGAPAAAPMATAAAPMEEREAYDAASGVAQTNRLVIKNATLSIVVTDPAVSVEQIGQMAEDMGGFVVASNVYQTTVSTRVGQPGELVNYGSITVRVPAARLTEAMERIKQGAGEVNNENISGQDVTQEYTDLQSRLKNLQAAEAQLKEIMASATKTEDVLAVYNQLVSVREQIEVIKGQMQYFEQAAAFSSISVDLTPDAATRPLEIGVWKPQGTAKEAIEALVQALQNVADGLIWTAIYILPLGLLFALPIYGFVRWLASRRRNRKTSVPGPTSA